MNHQYCRSFVLTSFYCIFLVLVSAKCRCQNKIYSEKEEIFGKVIEITPEKIKYRLLDNFDGPMYSITRSKVKLIFNETGGFLVLQKLDSMDTGQAGKLINNFINPPQTNTSLDKLFTIQNKQINCTILDEDDLLYSIKYEELDMKYDKASVAVIIYKNGKHKIISDLNTAIGVLGNLQPGINTKTGNSKVKKTSTDGTTTINNQPSLNEPATKVTEKDKADPAVQLSSKDEDEVSIQKKLIADSLAELKNKDKKYKLAIANAQALYKKEEYENAKAAYLIAAALKPDEKEPKEKIDSINNIIIYDSLVEFSNSLYLRGEYDSAMAIYKRMLELRPSDYFANKQINTLKEEKIKKEAEEAIRKETEREERFRNAVKRGNAFKKAADYKSALDAYNEAAAIHPENQDVQDNIRIVTHQLKLKESNNKPN